MSGRQDFVVLLPISDTHVRSSLHRADLSDEHSRREGPSSLALSADTGDSGVLLPERLGIMLVAQGPDPFRLTERLVQEAAQRLRKQLDMDGIQENAPPPPSAEFVDTFGWCTWDSFYTMVNPQGSFTCLRIRNFQD